MTTAGIGTFVSFESDIAVIKSMAAISRIIPTFSLPQLIARPDSSLYSTVTDCPTATLTADRPAQFHVRLGSYSAPSNKLRCSGIRQRNWLFAWRNFLTSLRLVASDILLTSLEGHSPALKSMYAVIIAHVLIFNNAIGYNFTRDWFWKFCSPTIN